MKKLNIEIPAFKRNLYAKVNLAKAKGSGLEYLTISGCDEVGGPYSIFRSIKINNEDCNQIPLKEDEKTDDAEYLVNMTFQGYYNEPSLKLSVPRSLMNKENKYSIKIKMVFDAATSQWETVEALKLEDETVLSTIEFKSSAAPARTSDGKDEVKVAAPRPGVVQDRNAEKKHSGATKKLI